VISSEEEEGHQGRIDRKVLFRYKLANNIDAHNYVHVNVILWKCKEVHLYPLPLPDNFLFVCIKILSLTGTVYYYYIYYYYKVVILAI